MKNIVLFTVMAFMLSGCLSLTSSQTPPVIYAMRAADAAYDRPSSVTAAGGVMLVLQPDLPAGFESDRIVLYMDGGRRLDYFAGARWAAPLDGVVQDVAVQAGRTALPQMIIDTPEINIPADYKLVMKINEFAPFYKGAADTSPELRVSLTFTLVALPEETILADFTLRDSRPADANTVSAVTVGLEEMLRGILATAYQKIGQAFPVESSTQ